MRKNTINPNSFKRGILTPLMRYLIYLIVLGFSILLIISLINGRHTTAILLQFIPPLIYLLVLKYPNNIILTILLCKINPQPKIGLWRSQLAAKSALFYTKFSLLCIILFICLRSIDLNMENLNNPIVIILYILPLSIAILLLISLFYTIKYVFIKVLDLLQKSG